MKHSLPPLDALKVFESAARQLSFSLAARELCITKGAVSYQIGRLEGRWNRGNGCSIMPDFAPPLAVRTGISSIFWSR